MKLMENVTRSGGKDHAYFAKCTLKQEKVTASSSTTARNIHSNPVNVDSIVTQYLKNLIERRRWDSRYTEQNCKTPLKTPITSIYVSESLGSNCYSYLSCVEVITDKLTSDAKSGNDSHYNFILTGDGFIFEGSSWNCTDVGNSTSIHVMLTGNSNSEYYKTSEIQFMQLDALITANVITGKISRAYAVGPICCAVPRQVPCKHLYQTLLGFKRFIPCLSVDQCLPWLL